MIKSLSDVIIKLLTKTSYISKKASLCCVRIIKKCPELIETIAEKLPNLLKEQRNHAVILTNVSMIQEIIIQDPKYIKLFRKSVPILVRILKGLLTSSYGLEHDVHGVSDPFLQVKILRLLRYLGYKSPKVSEAIGDILQQVASTTESSKNAGHAVLYECVTTILGVESDSTLRGNKINNKQRWQSVFWESFFKITTII
jgi:AP-1 complex subunit gamma-1